MKIREFITLEEDIDVYDDWCEDLAICFCGPLKLTEEGKNHFVHVLDFDIDTDFSGEIKTAVVRVDDEFFPEELNQWKLDKAKEFFYSAAGYCADEDWHKWFCEE